MPKPRRTDYELPSHSTSSVRGGYAAKWSAKERPLVEMRSRLEVALRRVEDVEAEKLGMRREIARLEQAVDDLEEALLHALRGKHAARRALEEARS